MYSPGDIVTIPTSLTYARTLPLTVVESDARHTLVRFSDGGEQWYDTNRLALMGTLFQPLSS